MSIDRRDDERPPGDPAVDLAWRTTATDEPSAQLDATILAAARAAAVRPPPARSPSARQWWTHWQPLAAAAGVAGLAFSIVQMLPRDQDVRRAPPHTAVQSEHAEVATQDNAAALAGPTAPAQAASAEEREAAPPPAAAAKGARSASALPVAPAVPAPAASVVAAPASPPADAARTTESPQSPGPHAWARRIEVLHAAGNHAAAAEELRAFRAAYPDADQYLPEALQSWAARLESPTAPVVIPR